EAKCLGGGEVDGKLKFGRLLDRDVGRLHSMQDFIHVICRVSEQFCVIWSVRHERSGFNKVALTEDCGQLLAKRYGKDAGAVGHDKLINRNINCVNLGFEALERGCDIVSPPDSERNDFEAKPASLGLRLAHLEYGLGVISIKQDGQSAEPWQNLTQEFNPLAGKFVRLDRQSSHVATRIRETCDKTTANRIDCHGKNDGNSRCRLFHNRHSASDSENDIDI